MCIRSKAEDVKTESAIIYFSIVRTIRHSYIKDDDYYLPEDILKSLANEVIDWVSNNIENRKLFNETRYEFMRRLSQAYAELLLGE